MDAGGGGAAGGGIDWDADDPFGVPPPGPQIRQRDWNTWAYENPHERDPLHAVSPGPGVLEQYQVRNRSNSVFTLETEQSLLDLRSIRRSNWPAVCTFSIDDSYKLKVQNPAKSQWPDTFTRPWGFLISKEIITESGGRFSEWWTIKVVQEKREKELYSHQTREVWSAPTDVVRRQTIENFAKWALRWYFATVCNFY